MNTPVTVMWHGDEWLAKAVPAFNRGVTAAAEVIANQASVNIGTEGGGLIGSAYKIDLLTGKRGRHIPGKKGRWIPAPPGAFPGNRHGGAGLKGSVAFVSPESLGTPLHAAAGTSVMHGRYLELGTSRMPARPWLVRSANQARAAATDQAIRATRRALKAAGLVTGGGQ